MPFCLFCENASPSMFLQFKMCSNETSNSIAFHLVLLRAIYLAEGYFDFEEEKNTFLVAIFSLYWKFSAAFSTTSN